VIEAAAPTLVHVERLSVDGDPQQLNGSVVVPSNAKRIVLEYVGLNLSSPDHVRYRFMLEGYEHTWNAPVAGREAAYTNLSPGPYRFRVIMASNADQVWSDTGADLSFCVDPAVWFRLASAFLCVAIMAALYRLRLRQITEQVNARFEARLAERTRIARELHDTLLQSFHGLMLRFQAAHNLLPEKPDQAKQSLDIAIERAAHAITEGRDAVQELRGHESGTQDFVEMLTALGQELAGTSDAEITPEFRVLLEGQP
jgi:signal transduction histidine kinase